MFKKLLFSLITAIIFIFYFLNNNSFAYDDKTTHPALTNEIVDFYNLSFPNKQLTSQEKEWIIEGSILEDTPPRWINHFYDPIYKDGWTGEKAGNKSSSTMISWATAGLFMENPISAVNWINNNLIQQRYSRYGGDRTWRKGLEYYISDNKEESYKTLGYILHLLEDQSVPDHTRNDTHAHELEKITGDYGSPYEEYLKKYNRQTIGDLDLPNNLKKENEQPTAKESIEDYLISLATYSNKYFFSKDTINDPKYENPKIIRDDGDFGYGIDESGKEFKLTRVWITKTNKFFILEPNDSNIIDQYFSRLSRQAILHGAGVINLFRRQAEDEIPAHLIKLDTSGFNIPMFSVIGEGFKSGVIPFFAQTISSIGGFFSDIFGSSQNSTQVIDNTGQNNVILGMNSQIDNQAVQLVLEENKNIVNKISVQAPTQKLTNENQNSQVVLTVDDEKDEQEIQNEENKLIQENQIRQITTTTQQISSSQQAVFKQCSFQTNQVPNHQKAIINEVAWTGTTESSNNEWIELKNIFGGDINLNGWQLIDQGEQIKITFGSTDKISANNFYLLERTDDNSVVGIQADKIYTGALSNTSEGLRLFDNQCNLIDEVLASPNWPAGDSNQKRTMERSPNLFWHTYNGIAQNNIFGTPRRENSAPSIINDNSGGGGTSSASTNNQQLAINNQQSSATKILINEIQLASSGNVYDEFVELYNPNNTSIDLTGWYIQKKTQNGSSYSTFAKADLFSGKIISANSYLLIANASSSFSADIFISSYSIADNNTLILKNYSGDIIDKVGWGTAGDCDGNCALNPADGQSIQRINFADTDINANDFEIQSCSSPKAPSKTCQSAQINQAPSAFFVYAPQNPAVGETITFNATSSTDSDGTISTYQWDFGDNATSSISQATTTHSYSTAGNYTASLTVLDNQNASSTATSATISVNLIGANHLVISEIYPDKTGSNFDFVELYNPTDSSINIGDYSLKILKEGLISDSPLSSFSASHIVATKSFFLIGLSNYGSSTYATADKLNRSYSLTTTKTATIILYDGGSLIDEINYNPANITNSQSLERKAFTTSTVDSMTMGEHRFSGNGYDTDNADDFILRNSAEPQNFSNFPEPRNTPIIPQNFNIQYSSSTMNLNLSWQESQDYNGATSTITYKITDTSASSSTFSNIETSATSTSFSINEIGRDYQFSIQAFDKEGLNSATSTASISIPSFLTSLYFYQDPRTIDIKYLVDMNWQNYPFVPKKIESDSSWRSIVFYLNKDADKVFNFGDWDWGTSASSSIKLSAYSNCGYSATGPALILPDDQNRCSNNYGGIRNATFAWSQLEDPHLMIGLDNLQQAFNNGDYLTIAFYAYDGNNGQALVAVDKTKYYFQNESPTHQAPSASQSFSFVSYDITSKDLMFSLNSAIDADSIDQNLSYLASFSTLTNFSIWENLGWYINKFQTKVQVNVGDKIAVKTIDDFNNSSPIKIITLTENNGQYGISVEDAQQPIKQEGIFQE